jgi:hypothetical protein
MQINPFSEKTSHRCKEGNSFANLDSPEADIRIADLIFLDVLLRSGKSLSSLLIKQKPGLSVRNFPEHIPQGLRYISAKTSCC